MLWTGSSSPQVPVSCRWRYSRSEGANILAVLLLSAAIGPRDIAAPDVRIAGQG